MMKVILFLSLWTLVSSATLEKSPIFSLDTDRSTNGLPSIRVTFPNGQTDTLVLHQFTDDGIDEDTIFQSRSEPDCRYMGHLLSEHAPGTGMFKWYKNGRVENVYTNEKKKSSNR